MSLITPEFADVIRAVASLLWPLLSFCLVFVFRNEFRNLIDRIKKAKFGPNEIELDRRVENLHQSSRRIVPEILGPRSEHGGAGPSSFEQVDIDHSIQRIYEYASKSPRVALLLLSGGIKSEASDLLASTGKWTKPRHSSFSEFIRRLDDHYGLPVFVQDSLLSFEQALDEIMNGDSIGDEKILLRAVDSGVTIYRALHALPRDQYLVHHEGVPLFSDQECRHEMPDVKGVILEVKSRGGLIRREIVPSTERHFRKGKQVSWDWNVDNVFPGAWYQDPESGEKKRAWRQEMVEFVGRNIEESQLN